MEWRRWRDDPGSAEMTAEITPSREIAQAERRIADWIAELEWAAAEGCLAEVAQTIRPVREQLARCSNCDGPMRDAHPCPCGLDDCKCKRGVCRTCNRAIRRNVIAVGGGLRG